MSTPTKATRVPRLPFRLAQADFLKLRKRRSVSITAALLTVGVMILIFVILELAHLIRPAHHGVAGGDDHFIHAVKLLFAIGCVLTGLLVGTAIGSMDRGARVWRDLVMTGRPRRDLYLARLPGAMALLWPLLGLALLLAAVICVADAHKVAQPAPGGFGGRLFLNIAAPPSTSLILKSALWIGYTAVVYTAFGLGLASLVRSRAAAIIIALAWLIPVEGILSGLSALGAIREGFLNIAAARLAPAGLQNGDDTVRMSFGAAVVVTLCWIVIPLVAGLLREEKSDA